MGMELASLYYPGVASRTNGAAPAPAQPTVTASGRAATELSGEVSAIGAPAVWFLLLAAAALVLLHLE